MKHTKGPWKVHSIGFIILDDGTAISIKNGTIDNRVENARLIAAAPEMLEALQKVLNSMLNYTENTRLSFNELNNIKDLINKVQGGGK